MHRGSITEPQPEVVLSVDGLTVAYGDTEVVRNASFTVRAGETVAIVGESGSGKSTMTGAILGLLPRTASVSGTIAACGTVVTEATERDMRALRGSQLAYVPQDPMSNLNPVLRVGPQVAEAGGVHRSQTRAEARTRAVAALERAGLAEAESRYRQFPHQLSGGMRQRSLIAMGMINDPTLLIADEPTSALDVTVQRVILDNLADLVARSGTSVLLVTHDLGLAAERADRVIVMRGGEIVEQGPSREVLFAPTAAYTRQLIGAAPVGRTAARVPRPVPEDAPVLLALENVGKVYPPRGHGSRRTAAVSAIAGVSLEVRAGQTLAIVGESGSGKSTAANIALKLTEPSSGVVRFDGADVTRLRGPALTAFRRRVQPIFQDPYASLDPMSTVGRIVEEPLRAFRIGDARSREERVRELLDLVGLPNALLERAPSELSGGQRQRVAIARALAPEPELIVCDEPVSALDVLVQATVLDVLQRIQSDLGVAYLFISHDLGVVESIAHDVVVMTGGTVVERGTVGDVFTDPQADYTRALLDAVPGRSLIDELALRGRPADPSS